MANIIDLTGLDPYLGKEANEIFIKPAFITNEDVTSDFDIMVNIKSSQKIVLDSNLEGIVVAANGNCAPDITGDVVHLNNKTITVCEVQMGLEQCARDLYNSFLEDKVKSGINGLDILEGDGYLQNYIETKVINGLKNDVPLIAWFGDSASLTPTINACDGMWKKLIASSLLPNGVTRAFTFNANLGDCESVEALEAAFEQAPNELDMADNSQKYIKVTRSVWENYRKCIENKCCGDNGVMMMQNGIQKLYYRGVEVRKDANWDRWISKYSLPNPHRLIYTWKPNLKLGVDMLDDLTTFDFFFDKNTRTNKIYGFFVMGVEFAYEDFTVIAY